MATENKKVAFNLATVEREQTYEPYVVALRDGSTITMTDPSELSWQELLEIENPTDFFRYCVSDEDKEKLRREPIPGWQFNMLIEDYQRHYGLGEKGNARASRI